MRTMRRKTKTPKFQYGIKRFVYLLSQLFFIIIINLEFQNDDDFKIEATDISLDIGRFEQDLNREDLNTNKRKDRITKIYACATMWHEERNEMNHLISSILRLDRDQCAMRVTQKHYKVQIEDYYELESKSCSYKKYCN